MSDITAFFSLPASVRILRGAEPLKNWFYTEAHLFILPNLMAFPVLPGHDTNGSHISPLHSSFLLLLLIFPYFWLVFHRPVCFRPLLLRRTPVNFHFFLIVAPAKWFRLLLGTLDKSVGGVSSAEHQRDVAWAGTAVSVIPCEGYILTNKPSGVAGSQSPFKRNWYHLQQPHLLVSTLLCFSEISPQALRVLSL